MGEVIHVCAPDDALLRLERAAEKLYADRLRRARLAGPLRSACMRLFQEWLSARLHGRRLVGRVEEYARRIGCPGFDWVIGEAADAAGLSGCEVAALAEKRLDLYAEL